MKTPGQKIRENFPRFGLPRYTNRFPEQTENKGLLLELNGAKLATLGNALDNLPRTTVLADFHCVTTWTYPFAKWEGVQLKDFYKLHVKASVETGSTIEGAVLYAQDGYCTTLLLEDLLANDVLIADSLDGKPLSIEHGAPIRLVAPKHYGYKNVKHLKRIAFFSKMPEVKQGVGLFLDHPRARVSFEERGRWLPGWLLRYPYRSLISGTVKQYAAAMEKYRNSE